MAHITNTFRSADGGATIHVLSDGPGMKTWFTAPWSKSCTQATVAALTGEVLRHVPRCGLDVLEAIEKAGLTYSPIRSDGEPFRGTVRRFVREHPTGRYYIASSGHSMAVVDGILTDTEDRGPDGRRLIGAFAVAVPKGDQRPGYARADQRGER